MGNVKWALLLMVVTAVPCHAANKVTVEELRQIVAAARSKPDGKAADEIYQLELTQRLSAAKLAEALAALPGPDAKTALKAVADEAEFLDLPAADLSAASPPDRDAQIALWTRTVKTAEATIAGLPNFFATRDTVHFQDTPPEPPRNTTDTIRYAPLHPVGAESVTVLYRDGHEFMESGGKHHKNVSTSDFELSTDGEFGPILSTVLADSSRGHVLWSHWESGAAGPMAVFRYAVDKSGSHYTVNFPGPEKDTQFVPPYHGEIGVNPADGSILRLTMVADLKPTDPVTRADLLVDYGPVEIGGVRYICPVKSAAVTLVHEVKVNMSESSDHQQVMGPLQTRVNEVSFRNYHLFRAEMRILTGDTPDAGQSATPGAPAPQPH